MQKAELLAIESIQEKLLGTPGAFSLLDIHVGSIMVTTFDPHMI
jgi:hypothetical protein